MSFLPHTFLCEQFLKPIALLFFIALFFPLESIPQISFMFLFCVFLLVCQGLEEKAAFSRQALVLEPVGRAHTCGPTLERLNKGTSGSQDTQQDTVSEQQRMKLNI